MHKKILVVGTTPDYIQWIRLTCPDRALFITDPDIRQQSEEEPPFPREEILIRLTDPKRVLEALQNHLKEWDSEIDSVFSFDCESMEAAAFIAEHLHFDYPSQQSIKNCRDKYVSKLIWQEHQIACPRVLPVNNVSEVISFFKTTPRGCVLKPFTGSGSELVFKCTSVTECHSAFDSIVTGLKTRALNPMFQRTSSTHHLMLAEERIAGTEYSCDFIVENHTVTVIRLARKITSPLKPFGTISGYIIPASLPPFIDTDDFNRILLKSATALGISRGLCMVDFMIADHQVVLIELTPRPGGDCLPHLLKECFHLDILTLSLDFAQKRPVNISGPLSDSPCVAIRLHAKQSGILKKIDDKHLLEDKRVKHVHLIRKPGHQIKLPPRDYDSWLLGHIIIEPAGNKFPESQALEISKKIEVVIEKE